MKLNEEKMEEMKEKFGSEKMSGFADMMIELLAGSGDKRATILQKRQENEKLYREIMDKFVMDFNNENEQKLDEIASFMKQINKLTKGFIKEMEEK